MKVRLLRTWDAIRSSYWVLPTLMTVAAVGLSQAALALDHTLLDRGIGVVAWLHGAGEPEGARALLSTVAGSMITVAGVTFSIVVVALSLASSQFGPRLLRGFLRDRGNQAVLGTFIATFVYCLLVLRNVPMQPGTPTVPQVAVTGALLLGLAGVAVLIFFIHHVASSIQASHVIEIAGSELDSAIRHTFPARGEDEGVWSANTPEELLPDRFPDEATTVPARASGYVQELDTDALLHIARARDLVIELLHARGSFVVEGRPLARASGPVDDDVEKTVAEAHLLAAGRSSSRDVERGISQLAEVAVRALSPGVNDPFTAGQALRRLGQSLAVLGDRKLPTSAFYDDDGTLRLVVPTPTVSDLLHLAFDQVRHYGRSDPHVPIDLLEVMTSVGIHARHPGLRQALLRHAEQVRQAALQSLDDESDRERVQATFENAHAVLTGSA